MSWERGFVICKDEVTGIVRSAVAEFNHCKLVSLGGETAFTFSGRGYPRLGEECVEKASVAFIECRNPCFSWDLEQLGFCPSVLIPRIVVTVGFVLRKTEADALGENAFIKALIAGVGIDEDSYGSDNWAGYRYDIECSVGNGQLQRKIGGVSKKLRAVQKQLDKLGVQYRLAVFENGMGSVEGELEDDGEMPYFGPQSMVKLSWSSTNGDNEVWANENEWLCEGLDITIPDGTN